MKFRITIRLLAWSAVIITAIVVFYLNDVRSTAHPETLSEYDVKMLESCTGIPFPKSTMSINTCYDGHDDMGFLCFRFDISDLETFLSAGDFNEVTEQILNRGVELDLDSLELEIWSQVEGFNWKPDMGWGFIAGVKYLEWWDMSRDKTKWVMSTPLSDKVAKSPMYSSGGSVLIGIPEPTENVASCYVIIRGIDRVSWLYYGELYY